MKEIEIKNVVQMYSNGFTIEEISKKFNCSRANIYRILKKNHIPLHTKKNNDINEEEIVKLYEKGCSINKISKIKSISYYSVKKILLERNSIIISTEIEQKIIKAYLDGMSGIKIAKIFKIDTMIVFAVLNKNNVLRDKHKMNGSLVDDFFFNKIDTEEKAYWLGFLMADGYVSGNKVGLALSDSDFSHLEKYKKAINSNAKISTYQSSGYSNSKYCRILIFSSKMSEDLIRHGCVEHKSLILKFPNFEDENLIRHFVRGYFDGDGSLIVTDKTFGIKICGTFEFLNTLIDYLNKNIKNYAFNYTVYQSKKMKGKNNYYLSFGGKYKVYNIAKWLYENSTIFLERKYMKFVLLKNIVEPIRNGGC